MVAFRACGEHHQHVASYLPTGRCTCTLWCRTIRLRSVEGGLRSFSLTESAFADSELSVLLVYLTDLDGENGTGCVAHSLIR